MNNREKTIKQVTWEYLGGNARMISHSKGQYNSDNPDHVTVFNANLVLSSGEKIWYGDLDLTVDEQAVRSIARDLGEKVFVLREMDARFENETAPKLGNAVYSTDGETNTFDTTRYHYNNNDRLVDIPAPAPTEEEKEAILARTKASYAQEDFEVIKLKVDVDDLTEVDEEYEDYNYLETEQFFENLTKETSPLHNFHKFFKETQGFADEQVLKVYLTKETAEALQKQVEYWFRIFHAGYMSEYKIKSNLAFFWMDVGPCEFQENPDWAVEGKVYVRKPKED